MFRIGVLFFIYQRSDDVDWYQEAKVSRYEGDLHVHLYDSGHVEYLHRGEEKDGDEDQNNQHRRGGLCDGWSGRLDGWLNGGNRSRGRGGGVRTPTPGARCVLDPTQLAVTTRYGVFLSADVHARSKLHALVALAWATMTERIWYLFFEWHMVYRVTNNNAMKNSPAHKVISLIFGWAVYQNCCHESEKLQKKPIHLGHAVLFHVLQFCTNS